MAFRTALTDLFGIRHPILPAPMGGVSGSALAAAVSRAGGLGLLGPGYQDEAWIEREFAAADGVPVDIGFIAWHLDRHPDRLRAALAHRPAAVMLSFGDPAPFVPSIHAAGAKLILQVQTLADARAAAALAPTSSWPKARRPGVTGRSGRRCRLCRRWSTRSPRRRSPPPAASPMAAASPRRWCWAPRGCSSGRASMRPKRPSGIGRPTLDW